MPARCVDSVQEIRRFLTTEIGKLGKDSEFASSLRALRAACRKFLTVVEADHGETVRFVNEKGHWASWKFYSALGEMRGSFGVHVARIAAMFGLDVEDELAAILPAKAD